MNNSFQNAINPQKKHHVRIIWPDGKEVVYFDAMVRTYQYTIALELDGNILRDIAYSDMHRIEIHACQFPYKENTPFLYIYLK